MLATTNVDLKPRPSPNALVSEAERERVSGSVLEALIRLADLWHLTNSEAARLFGFTLRTWLRVKARDWHGSLSQDQITRASLLLGIFEALEIVFSQLIARDWGKLPNAEDEFGGKRPVDVMFQGGIPAMMVVRQYVDALREGI